MVRSSEGETKPSKNKNQKYKKNTILEEKKMELIILILKVIGFGFVAMMASTIIHEGGHVIAGLVQGWKFAIMVIGPIKIYRDEKDDKVKIGIEKNPALWGGLGGTIPREKSDENLKAYAKILLAGPIASFVLGGISGICMIFHPSLFVMLMTFMPISMGSACLLPNAKTGLFYTDGGRYLRIVKGGKTYEEEKALFDAAMHATFSPEEKYDEKGVETLIASEDKSFSYMGHYYAYLNAKKEDDAEEMKEQIAVMETLRKDVPQAIADMCVVEN